MTSENDVHENARRFRWLLGSIVATGLALTLGSGLLKGSHAGGSAAIGAAVAAANFVALRYIVHALAMAAAGAGARRGGIASVLLGMKLVILLAGVWLLLSWRVVSAAPLAIGYCALPIGVAIGTLLCDKATRTNA